MTLKDLSSVVDAEHGFIIVGAEWCKLCKEIQPILDDLMELTQELPSNYIAWEEINVDLNSVNYPFLQCIIYYPEIIEIFQGTEIRRYGADEIDQLKQYIYWLRDNYQ